TGRVWVKRAAMAHFLNIKMPAYFVHNIVRSHSSRFIDQERAIQRRKFLHHSSSITFAMVAMWQSDFEEKTVRDCSFVTHSNALARVLLGFLIAMPKISPALPNIGHFLRIFTSLALLLRGQVK